MISNRYVRGLKNLWTKFVQRMIRLKTKFSHVGTKEPPKL